MESITELRVEFLEPKLFLIKITTCLDHEAVFVSSVGDGCLPLRVGVPRSAQGVEGGFRSLFGDCPLESALPPAPNHLCPLEPFVSQADSSLCQTNSR